MTSKTPSSKRGKENAPPRAKAPKITNEPEDDFDTFLDDEPAKPVKKIGRPPKIPREKSLEVDQEAMVIGDAAPLRAGRSTNSVHSKSLADESDLRRVQAECERLRRERDAFAKQLDELSSLRNSGPESLLVRFKEAAEAKAKAQAEVIRSQDALYEKQTAKVKSLEEALASSQEALARTEAAAAPPKFDAKLERMGQRELQDEVHKLRDVVKAKDGEIVALQREYQEEIAHSRKLQESAAQMRRSAEPPAKPVVNEVHSLSVRLYEELTGLDILDAQVRHEPKTGDERIYKCIQTTGGRNYTLRLCLRNEFDKHHKQWEKIVEFAPQDMDKETDRKLLKRLGPFRDAFNIPREQLPAAYAQLTARMDPEGQFEEPELTLRDNMVKNKRSESPDPSYNSPSLSPSPRPNSSLTPKKSRTSKDSTKSVKSPPKAVRKNWNTDQTITLLEALGVSKQSVGDQLVKNRVNLRKLAVDLVRAKKGGIRLGEGPRCLQLEVDKSQVVDQLKKGRSNIRRMAIELVGAKKGGT
ncbi:hypothetical protein CspeluHIS016_0309480 [Cutaneotrichosporon spelunceum]|uniref:Monopolin complex subunit Csm1/Pcs1 C-terminal domain-containing protein n=1 Tax=Cutaneotrichosporon spelunceum TaxID=1672016 RepID=A0AAD3TV10_9TREE|nr:hypothetical protein CspeluHIS016_0309480 [Cutaneotrichosporon spelunceum]